MIVNMIYNKVQKKVLRRCTTKTKITVQWKKWRSNKAHYKSPSEEDFFVSSSSRHLASRCPCYRTCREETRIEALLVSSSTRICAKAEDEKAILVFSWYRLQDKSQRWEGHSRLLVFSSSQTRMCLSSSRHLAFWPKLFSRRFKDSIRSGPPYRLMHKHQEPINRTTNTILK